MLYKKIIFFIILINISLLSFSESLVLSNGKVINGKLFLINKNDLVLKVNDKLLKFSYDLIDCLIHNNNQEKEIILLIEKKDGNKEKINLLKLTKNALFYKDPKNKQIDLILFDEIKYIKLETLPKINENNIKEYKIDYKNDINNDLKYLIQLLIKKNKSSKEIKNNEITSYNLLNFNELNFYEKFWRKVNNFINDDTKNLLWNLYELYSNKEKYLNLLNNNNSTSNNENISELNEVNNKIIELRKEFYLRAKKIIYNTEILINYAIE